MIEYIKILQEMRDEEERKLAYLKSVGKTKRFSAMENEFISKSIADSKNKVNALGHVIYQRITN